MEIQRTKGIQQSRLDYFLISNKFIYRIGKCEIGPCIYSDHNIINIEIKVKPETEKGRGFWKLNTSLLRDKEYVTKINNIIDETIEIHKNMRNPGLLWDTIKMKIRGVSISHASHKAKMKRIYEIELEQERINIENTLAIKPNDETYEMHENIKKEIEAVNNEKARGTQIRARCTHIELNKHSTKYFLVKK